MWSPKGRHIVLATLASPTKFDIEFWDLDFTTDDNPNKKEAEPGANVQMLGTGEHYGVTDIAWDPSGRYLATHASAWRQSVSCPVGFIVTGSLADVQPEPGYKIWDFKGTELVSQQLDRFKQFLWRPRPPTLLSKDQQRKVRKELKEHSRAFDEEDAAEENRGSAEKLAQRQREIAEWDAWRARNVARLAEARKARGKELKKATQEAGEEEKVEEWIEEMIDETEEVVV
jgi:translation initiation factor 3 subunit B